MEYRVGIYKTIEDAKAGRESDSEYWKTLKDAKEYANGNEFYIIEKVKSKYSVKYNVTDSEYETVIKTF